LLGRSDLLAGHFNDMWLRVYTGGAGDVERMGSRTKWAGVGGVGAGLRNSSSTGARCGNHGEILFFEGRQGRMLDAAGSGSKEEAKSTLGRVIVRVIDWGYRSVMDRDKDMMSTTVR